MPPGMYRLMGVVKGGKPYCIAASWDLKWLYPWKEHRWKDGTFDVTSYRIPLSFHPIILPQNILLWLEQYGTPVHFEEKLMPKNAVTVDGVTLTRTQVEAALAELNAPDPPKPQFKSGDIVTKGSGDKRRFVVVGGPLGNRLNDVYSILEPCDLFGRIRVTNGETCYSAKASEFTLVDRLNP